MKLTPLDILRKKFPTKLRGLDSKAVYSFLELVREQMEELSREIIILKEESARGKKELEGYKKVESDLENTLILTQKLVEKYKEGTEKDVHMIWKEAERQANRFVKKTQKNAVSLHNDIADLKVIKRHFQQELKLLIDGHLKMLKENDGMEHISDSKIPTTREKERRLFIA